MVAILFIGNSESNLSQGTGKTNGHPILWNLLKSILSCSICEYSQAVQLTNLSQQITNTMIKHNSKMNPILRTMKKITAVLMFLTICVSGVNGQIDTIIFLNGDMMVGELKKMTNAVMQIKTDYSDSDFKAEWDEVARIYTSTYYLVSLENGLRLNGKIRTSPIDSSVVLIGEGPQIISTTLSEILYMQSVKKNIWSRFDVLLEVGFYITKANNLRQFNSRTAFGYTADTWLAKGSYNAVNSNQDSIASTKRTDASLTANWFLQHDWFILAASDFLQNDEQKIKLRATPRAGMGNYLIRNNHWFLSGAAGLAMNIETFQTDQPDLSSLEGFISTEANLFNINNFSMLAKVSAYPSITEGGRFRSDINFDMKYDLFGSDFYVKFGVTFNYDNRPAANASTSDYIFQTTFGWEL
jgi:Protein of unknown function, DUF481